jgi:hypothetical protein
MVKAAEVVKGSMGASAIPPHGEWQNDNLYKKGESDPLETPNPPAPLFDLEDEEL